MTGGCVQKEEGTHDNKVGISSACTKKHAHK
jgi:hypothetical protein